MTKAEIKEQFPVMSNYYDQEGYETDDVDTIMDEWAKTQCVAFMEWAYNEQWQPYDGYDRWINTDQGNVVLSTPALYESFLLAQLKNNDR